MIILIFFGILIFSFFMVQKFLLKNKDFKIYSHPELEETACNRDEDCVLSENHPKFAGICVNKNWQDEWNKNPDSEKYLRDCMVGPVCTGPEFVAGGMRMPKNNCQCVNSRCQTADLTNYPGCQMVGCD